MKIIIGLGNPGKKYEKTRHNLGFLVVDYIQANINNFSTWQLKKRLKTEIAEGSFSSLRADSPAGEEARQSHSETIKRVILGKPQTYMNNSGEATQLLLSFFKLQPSDLIIIHDDFDLPFGEYKLEKGRGSAGHKGVQSIIDALGTNAFWRLRMGIKPIEIESEPSSMSFPPRICHSRPLRQSFSEASESGNPVRGKLQRESSPLIKAEDFVLKNFTEEERKIIDNIIPKAVDALLKHFS